MIQTRNQFTHDALIGRVKACLEDGLKRTNTKEKTRLSFSNIDCLMSGLAVFTFKNASLLQFDQTYKTDDILRKNIKRLFSLDQVPCDTHMRERLDVLDPDVCRTAFTKLFSELQRGGVLNDFLFFKDHYLVSIDGTGLFSSSTIHCQHCCVKNHRNGTKTYHHQMLSAALVHPGEKVVFPFMPEPISNTDGAQKNDCERNAAKRWIADFRREHPHLKTIIVADGLSSNDPFISCLKENNLRFILTCKEGDHAYLTHWFNEGDSQDKRCMEIGTAYYEWMDQVPLNESKNASRVTVVRFKETKKGKTTKWMWVTDLVVTQENMKEFVIGARARWKIENETFNTLKNQGYEFEHNFGHGKQNLNRVFSNLMMLAFYIDQCLQKLNKLFIQALARAGAKKRLWEYMVYAITTFSIPDFETLYHSRVHPPDVHLPSVI